MALRTVNLLLLGCWLGVPLVAASISLPVSPVARTSAAAAEYHAGAAIVPFPGPDEPLDDGPFAAAPGDGAAAAAAAEVPRMFDFNWMSWPDYPVPGGMYTFKLWIYNGGPATIPASKVSLWANTTLAPACRPEGADKTYTMPSVPPFEFRIINSVTFRIPSNVGPATWRLFIDSLCRAPGSKSNPAQYSWDYSTTTEKTIVPFVLSYWPNGDLTNQAVSSPKVPSLGEAFSFNVTIINWGTQAMRAGAYKAVAWVSGSNQSQPCSGASGSVTVALPRVPPGPGVQITLQGLKALEQDLEASKARSYVHVCTVDARGGSDSNSRVLLLPVAPTPSAVILSPEMEQANTFYDPITFEPQTPVAGGRMSVSVTVANYGTAPGAVNTAALFVMPYNASLFAWDHYRRGVGQKCNFTRPTATTVDKAPINPIAGAAGAQRVITFTNVPVPKRAGWYAALTQFDINCENPGRRDLGSGLNFFQVIKRSG